MSSPASQHSRLWRVRKRQSSIDAILRVDADMVTLEYVLNGRRITLRRWPTRAQAMNAASERRAELERAGWTEHW
jgi:hypothetical protein